MSKYARIIVDISQEKLDKTFDYRIPEHLRAQLAVGMQVTVPFGNRRMTGYVIELTDETDYDEEKIKDIFHITKNSVPLESHLIALAAWMRQKYGGTMNHALKTVLPVKQKKKMEEHKRVRLPFTRWRRKIFLQNMRGNTARRGRGFWRRCLRQGNWIGRSLPESLQ